MCSVPAECSEHQEGPPEALAEPGVDRGHQRHQIVRSPPPYPGGARGPKGREGHCHRCSWDRASGHELHASPGRDPGRLVPRVGLWGVLRGLRTQRTLGPNRGAEDAAGPGAGAVAGPVQRQALGLLLLNLTASDDARAEGGLCPTKRPRTRRPHRSPPRPSSGPRWSAVCVWGSATGSRSEGICRPWLKSQGDPCQRVQGPTRSPSCRIGGRLAGRVRPCQP